MTRAARMTQAKASTSKRKRRAKPAKSFADFQRAVAEYAARMAEPRWKASAGAYTYAAGLRSYHLLPILALDVVEESHGWSLNVSVSWLHGHAYAQAGKW